ncbi:ABC transporter permease [Cohnella phaseoli]|uniref:Putative aldouronate transport system permease protein n=1 Tax=Cohnella phaseoli TaxID=456490 RepID=A0A3D9HTD4_9BACL|nr:ABC transporter permease subunit [Cohnella phaseoli]RED52774.1 putative aldouronate transport system permease protein [Cohnella phaseoli]
MRRSIPSLIHRYKLYYFLIAPGIIYYLIFHYIPLYGVVIAFKDVSPFDGVKEILTSEWVGLKHFRNFTNSYYFWDIMRNTLLISLYRLIFGFPAPILLAILLNEAKNILFQRVVQTVSYLPHFISMVIVAGLLTTFLTTDGGIVNTLLQQMGLKQIFFLGDANYFRSVLVISGIWKEVGWGTIIYLAAIAGIDAHLYEAAKLDGAGRMRQIWHVTLPGMSFIITLLLILSIGGLLDAGFEQIFLLYSPSVFKVADIIDTYVYRKGLVDLQYSYAAAVNLFKSLIAVILLLGANYLAKKYKQEGIW